MSSRSIRWGLVTFTLGISSGLLGHFLESPIASVGVIALTFFFSFIGVCVIEDEPLLGVK